MRLTKPVPDRSVFASSVVVVTGRDAAKSACACAYVSGAAYHFRPQQDAKALELENSKLKKMVSNTK
jgi:hypothetical protein